jgi:hypothetical protein
MIMVRRSAAPAKQPAAEPLKTASTDEPERPDPPASLNGHGHAAVETYADDLARGELPGIRRIRRDLKVGHPRVQQVRDYLSVHAEGSRSENQN